MVRTYDYTSHCYIKHGTGSFALNELTAKVARFYVDNFDNLSEEEKKYVQEFYKYLCKIAVELDKFNITKVFLMPTWDLHKAMVTQAYIWSIRSEFEKKLKEWADFLKSKGVDKDVILAHVMEGWRFLQDLYKMEQDHIPEIVYKVEFELKERESQG